MEDNADLMLSWRESVGLFEGSWDLPRGFQDLEIFGRRGSVYMKDGSVELRTGRDTKQLPIDPLPAERAEPIAYLVHALQANKPLEGLTALDINVGVVEIVEAAKKSVENGNAVSLPLKA